MKEEFLEYIGAADSLRGYSRSYKLILFKYFFKLMDEKGTVNANELSKKFKEFYEKRITEGKIADSNVDARIENIKHSSIKDIYDVIIQNPYKHINAKGFIFKKELGSGELIFYLPTTLAQELTDGDLIQLKNTIDLKIKLYFDRIDNGLRTNIPATGSTGETAEHSGRRRKSHMQRLIDRIDHEFDKCKYIGDIQIDEEDYERLLKLFSGIYERICNSYTHLVTSKILAVALVQIGIHDYNGSFWNHVGDKLGVKLSAIHQGWMGHSFYETLKKYDKFRVSEKEMVNNILLHCFITKYYANDLFDFLFAYYQIDLDRDLGHNNKEMRNYLIQSMEKGERSARAYKIKKHTADAVLANPRGFRIRIGRILRFMDNALFYDILPVNSKHRISRLFCEWTQNSKKFNHEKKKVLGLNKKGKKQFSTPYLHFDSVNMNFCLILPPQYVHLNNEEEIPDIMWRITIDSNIQQLDALPGSSVTGCKTERIKDFIVEPNDIYENIKIELLKNNQEVVHKFVIKADNIRFFDDDLDMVNYSDYLPAGQLYAFTQSGDLILSGSEAFCEREKIRGMTFHNMYLNKGDIVCLPSGVAKSVGRPLEEGLQFHDIVRDVYVVKQEETYPVFRALPSIYFRIKKRQENGICLYINNKPFRLEIEKCIEFGIADGTSERGYILNLNEYISADGIYDVIVDIPNSKKSREYSFAYIQGFDFEFKGLPYIFKETGKIKFTRHINIASRSYAARCSDNVFLFDILPNEDNLMFTISTSDITMDILIELPVFKWKFNDDYWHTERPKEIWHSEFPKVIYLKYPDDNVKLSMNPIILDTNEDENENFIAVFSKNKKENVFECDTRKILSWFGYEEHIRPLYIEFEDKKFPFLSVVTRCFIADDNSNVIEDREKGLLIFKNLIIGFNDCVADIYFEDELIAEKMDVTTGGMKLNIPFRSGTYKVVYFELDTDYDFGFEDYRQFGIVEFKYVNKRDLTNKSISIIKVIQKKDPNSVFAASSYIIKEKLIIKKITVSDQNPNVYYGILQQSNKNISVKIYFTNEKMTNAIIQFYDKSEEAYYDFLYDKNTKTIVRHCDKSDNNRVSGKQYIQMTEDKYYFEVKIQ